MSFFENYIRINLEKRENITKEFLKNNYYFYYNNFYYNQHHDIFKNYFLEK